MKHKLILLYPFKFTDFEHYKLEINQFKKLGYKIIIIDLSKILINNEFNKVWRTKKSNFSICLNSILDFYKFLKRNKTKSVILNHARFIFSFKNCLILIMIKILKIKQLFICDEMVPYNSKRDKNIIIWLLKKIKEHNFNLAIYKFYFEFYLSQFIFYLLKINQEITFSNLKKTHKNLNLINFYDYSNCLLPTRNEKSFKNYCLYLDNGYPYFSGDAKLNHKKVIIKNNKKIYLRMTSFFNKIENDFNCKVIIIPHPKYKSSIKNHSLNPYYKNFNVDNRFNALALLSKNSKFFLARGSNAISYAVKYQKPVISFYSSELEPELNNDAFKAAANIIGNKIYDIDNYSKKTFKKKLQINKKKYKIFFYHYLSHKSILNIPNYKIISNYIKNNF